MRPVVLIVHSEAGFRRQLVRALAVRDGDAPSAHLEVKTCEGADSALSVLRSTAVAVAVVAGELLVEKSALVRALSDVEVIVTLGAEPAEALPRFVVAVIDEGSSPDRASFAVARALDLHALRHAATRRAATSTDHEEDPVVATKAMRSLVAKVRALAASSVPVAFLGEAGTGRELLARFLHRQSGRGELVVVSASNDGDVSRAVAKAAPARSPTTLLVLDAEKLGPAQGEALLTLVAPPHRHVRVVVTASPSIREAVRAGGYSRELFLRLGEGLVELPALRARRDDIPVLASHFLRKKTSDDDARFVRIGVEAMRALRRAPWPGNIDELEAAIEHAKLVAKNATIVPGDLPDLEPSLRPIRLGLSDEPYAEARKGALLQFERAYVTELLERTAGNLAQAAKAAGMDRANFRRLARRGEKKPGASAKARGKPERAAIRPVERDPDES